VSKAFGVKSEVGEFLLFSDFILVSSSSRPTATIRLRVFEIFVSGSAAQRARTIPSYLTGPLIGVTSISARMWGENDTHQIRNFRTGRDLTFQSIEKRRVAQGLSDARQSHFLGHKRFSEGVKCGPLKFEKFVEHQNSAVRKCDFARGLDSSHNQSCPRA
jgi:hypothetical protein